MTDDDVKDLFGRLVADPPASAVDLDKAIRDGRRQHARKQQLWIGTAAAGALAAAATFSAITGGSDSSNADSPGVTGQVLPDQVVVTCTPNGIEVSATEIRTRPDGVAMVVSSSLPGGGYLSVTFGTKSDLSPIPGHEGAPLTSVPDSWTSALRPGRWVLACGERIGSSELVGEPKSITIVDPDGNWHGRTAIDALGCTGGALADWNSEFYQEGRTPEEAVAKVGEAFDSFGGTTSDFTAEEVQVDYGTEPFQTWVLRRNGEPYVTVLVNRDGNRFKAGPNDRCSGFALSAG